VGEPCNQLSDLGKEGENFVRGKARLAKKRTFALKKKRARKRGGGTVIYDQSKKGEHRNVEKEDGLPESGTLKRWVFFPPRKLRQRDGRGANRPRLTIDEGGTPRRGGERNPWLLQKSS